MPRSEVLPAGTMRVASEIEQSDAPRAFNVHVIAECARQVDGFDVLRLRAPALQQDAQARRDRAFRQLQLADIGLADAHRRAPASTRASHRPGGRWAGSRPGPDRPRPLPPGRCRRCRAAGYRRSCGIDSVAVAGRTCAIAPAAARMPMRMRPASKAGPAAVDAHRIRPALPNTISPFVPRSIKARRPELSDMPVAMMPASRSLPTNPPRHGQEMHGRSPRQIPVQLCGTKNLLSGIQRIERRARQGRHVDAAE